MLSNFKNKRKTSAWTGFLLYTGGFFLLFLLIALVVNDIRIYQKRKEFLAQISNLQNQIKDIQNNNDNLKQGIAEANDSQYIEKVAREQLDLQKPGEKAVSFIMPPDQSQKTNPAQPNNIQGWFGRLWDWVRGK